jgi:hypothetical protein
MHDVLKVLLLLNFFEAGKWNVSAAAHLANALRLEYCVKSGQTLAENHNRAF